jgi:hypothetical protein
MNRLITGGLSLALLVAASTAALAKDTAPVRSAADLPAVRIPTAEPPSKSRSGKPGRMRIVSSNRTV